jgi:ArsR family transcriptional regulator
MKRTPTPSQRTEHACCEPVTIAPADNTLDTVSLAAQLKALADPTRLAMLDLLGRHGAPLCVCEITDRFPQRQPTISHHLRILRDAGLISTEKRGVWAYYWATEAGTRSLAAVRALEG